MIQRDNYIRSWRLQNRVVAGFVAQAKQAGLPRGARIIGNVPHWLPSNYNDEEVFGNHWDFGRALRLATRGRVAGGIPVTRTQIDQGNVQQHGEEIFVNGLWRADASALWFFEFDQATNRCRLLKIRDGAHLAQVLGELAGSEVNHVPESPATRLPAQWKEFFRRHGF
jgi:hypothetical protein